ncbi:MAG: hypothetical protein KUG79_10130 [Pseudomonadales bacterium]|nr:hypothetical protein [Pseudomonadales bacterium]
MSMKLTRNFLILSCSILLTSCVSYENINSLVPTPYNSINIVSNVPQEEITQQIIYSDSSSAAGGQGGAIGALILAIVDSSVNNKRAKKAEQEAEQLRMSLAGFDATGVFNQHYDKDLQHLKIGPVSDFSIETGNEKFDAAEYLSNTQHQSILYIQSMYRMTPHRETLELVAYYSIYDRTQKQPVYSNQVIYQSPVRKDLFEAMTAEEKELQKIKIEDEYSQRMEDLNNSKYTQSDAKKKVAAKDRDKKLKRLQRVVLKSDNPNDIGLVETRGEMKRVMALGISEISRLIAADLNGVGGYTEQSIKVAIPTIVSGQPNLSSSTKVYPVESLSTPDQQVVRLPQGTLISKSPYSPYMMPGGRN